MSGKMKTIPKIRGQHVTGLEKAHAVVDGFTNNTTLERRREWFGWLLPPVTLSLSEEVVHAILETADEHPGVNPKLIGLSDVTCCERPMVIVHTYNTQSRHAFSPRVMKILNICSACGVVLSKSAK